MVTGSVREMPIGAPGPCCSAQTWRVTMDPLQARLQEILPGEHPGSAERGASAVAPVYTCVEAWLPTGRDRLRRSIASEACI